MCAVSKLEAYAPILCAIAADVSSYRSIGHIHIIKVYMNRCEYMDMAWLCRWNCSGCVWVRNLVLLCIIE